MATFTIKVTQTDIGYVTVEADSRQEAKRNAAVEWYEGNTEWVTGNTDLQLSEAGDNNVQVRS